jgi:hypothetical protein
MATYLFGASVASLLVVVADPLAKPPKLHLVQQHA